MRYYQKIYIKLLRERVPFYCISQLFAFLFWNKKKKIRQHRLPTVNKSDLKLKQFESDYRCARFHPLTES